MPLKSQLISSSAVTCVIRSSNAVTSHPGRTPPDNTESDCLQEHNPAHTQTHAGRRSLPPMRGLSQNLPPKQKRLTWRTVLITCPCSDPEAHLNMYTHRRRVPLSILCLGSRCRGLEAPRTGRTPETMEPPRARMRLISRRIRRDIRRIQ